jgi:transposase-like protein
MLDDAQDSPGCQSTGAGDASHKLRVQGCGKQAEKQHKSIEHRPDVKDEDVARLYENGLSVQKIGRFLHISPTTAMMRLRRHGVKLRPRIFSTIHPYNKDRKKYLS